MSSIDDSVVQQFCSITGLSAERAKFYVEAANGNLDLAVGQYFENQGDTNDDEFLAAPENDEEESFEKNLPQPIVQKIEPKKDKAKSSTSSNANKKMFTLADLGGGEDDDSNSSGEEGQAFYAGGSETSGQQILGPPRQRDPNKVIKDMFQKAKEMGAEEVPSEPVRPDKPYQAIGGYRLGDGSGPSVQVASSTASNAAKSKQSQIKTLKLWKNGFNVDDGPLRLYEDRNNVEFLNSVRSGITPQELVREAKGGEVQLEMQDHRDEEFVPPKSAYVLFNNEGHKLGSPTPKVVSNTAPEAAKKNEENAAKVLRVDEAQPKTQIRLTLSDGSKLNVTANHSHKLSDLRNFLVTARPEYNAHRFLFQTSFPKKDIDNESKTLKEENLLNSVLIVKLI